MKPNPSSPARDGGSHWAGAKRPNANAQKGPQAEKKVPQPAELPGNCVNTIPGPASLGVMLRQRAKALGLAPGTPRWRAYVLGTQAAAAKRRREKAKKRNKSETGLVTPGNSRPWVAPG